MGKKILTVLAPVLAIMAFAVLPAMAQAAPEMQVEGGSAAGHTVQAVSSDLTFIPHYSASNVQTMT